MEKVATGGTTTGGALNSATHRKPLKVVCKSAVIVEENYAEVWIRLNKLMLGYPSLANYVTNNSDENTDDEVLFEEVERFVKERSIVEEDLEKYMEKRERSNEHLKLHEYVDDRVSELVPEGGHYNFEFPDIIKGEIDEIIKNDRDARDKMGRIFEEMDKLVEKKSELKSRAKDIEENLLKSRKTLLKNGVKEWELNGFMLGELLLAELSLRNPTLELNKYFEMRKKELGISKETLEEIRKGALSLIEENNKAKEEIERKIRCDDILSEQVDAKIRKLREKGVEEYRILPIIAEKIEKIPERGKRGLFDVVY